MDNIAMSPSWYAQFPELHSLDDRDQDLLLSQASVVTLPCDTTIFFPGAPAENFLLILEGTVRVQQVSAGGREIILYRVSGGESCIMTTACLMSHDTYAAEGITETPVTAVAIPRQAFDELMARSTAFRAFVFSNYSNRLANLMRLVDEVAFQRIDKRLAHKLVERADTEGRLAATHQDLATELGSAREVISRHLKEFQRRGLLFAARGSIEIRNRAALERIAASPD
jgi:CRP/FNR family transcriptional regulator